MCFQWPNDLHFEPWSPLDLVAYIQDPALISAKVVLWEVRNDFPRFELPCRPMWFWNAWKTVRLQRRPPDFCWEGYDLRCNAVREQQQLFVYSTRLQRLFVQILLIQSMQKTCSVKCSLLLCVSWSCVVCILFLPFQSFKLLLSSGKCLVCVVGCFGLVWALSGVLLFVLDSFLFHLHPQQRPRVSNLFDPNFFWCEKYV